MTCCDGPVGPVDVSATRRRSGWAATSFEQRARLLGGDAGGDDADVDTARVHGDEQVLQRGGRREVAAEQLGDALVSRPGP